MAARVSPAKPVGYLNANFYGKPSLVVVYRAESKKCLLSQPFPTKRLDGLYRSREVVWRSQYFEPKHKGSCDLITTKERESGKLIVNSEVKVDRGYSV